MKIKAHAYSVVQYCRGFCDCRIVTTEPATEFSRLESEVAAFNADNTSSGYYRVIIPLDCDGHRIDCGDCSGCR